MSCKIFCLGAFRTGTTSLAAALRILGFKVCESHEKLRWGLMQYKEGHSEKPYQQLLMKFDALAQQPVANHYRLLYEHYPDAYYILTYREPEQWIFSRTVLIMDTWFFHNKNRDKWFNPQAALRWYEKHNKGVREFFGAHPEAKFMEMDITKGNAWRRVCGFLDLPIPDGPFPHRNGSGFLLKRLLRKRKGLDWKAIPNPWTSKH